jgi:hypothetical protein
LITIIHWLLLGSLRIVEVSLRIHFVSLPFQKIFFSSFHYIVKIKIGKFSKNVQIFQKIFCSVSGKNWQKNKRAETL